MKKQDKFMELISPVYKNLERFCLSITNTREDAKELMSETVAAAYESFNNINSEKAMLSWLFTTARRIFYRSLEKRRRIDLSEPESFDIFQSKELSPDQLTEINILYAAMDSIDAKHREVFVLHELNGYKLKEVAEMLEITNSAAKVRLHRARKMLSELIEELNTINIPNGN